MPNTIVIKNSSTVSDVPTAGQLVQGELAVNVNDQKLYSKDATTVFEIGAAQTSIVGITGTMAQFDTAVTDGNIAYAGGAYHDGFSDFVTQEHIRWDLTGTGTIHATNYTNTVYTHPSHPGDDFSVDSGALSGATIISDIDINVTTDAEGHVTDANGVIATRELTASNIGAGALSDNEVVVGHWGIPSTINTQNGNYPIVLSDAGKTIYKASGGAGETWTIPSNASIPLPVGTMIGLQNDGGGTLSIAITTDTLKNAIDGSTGTQTLADDASAVIQKVTTTLWKYTAVEGASAEINDLTSVVTWANVPNANITQGSITQHEAALTILETQITDGAILARVAGNENISGNWEWQDNISLRFGAGNDARIYFSGVDWFFDMVDGADFRLRGGAALDLMIVATQDSNVVLYNNNVAELRTANSNATDFLSGAQAKDYGQTWRQVGFVDMEEVTFSGDTVVANDHWHKSLVQTGVTTRNLTFDTAATVPDGAVLWVKARGGDVTLVDGTMALNFYDGSGAPATGNRTLTRGGWATVNKTGDSTADVTGVGLS